MPLGGEGWPAAEMLEKPRNVKKPEENEDAEHREQSNSRPATAATFGNGWLFWCGSWWHGHCLAEVDRGRIWRAASRLPQRRAVRPVSPPRPSMERPWRHKASEALRSGDQRRQPAGLRNAHPWIAIHLFRAGPCRNVGSLCRT